MAEVTGELGGEQIILNNAATEATLKQLVAAVGVLASKTNNAYKSAQNFEKDIKRFQSEMNKAALKGKQFGDESLRSYLKHKQNTEAIGENTSAVYEESSARSKAKDRINNFSATLTKAISQISNTISSMANMGDSMSNAAGIFGKIPIVGGTLETVFQPVAAAADNVWKSFQEVGSVGANFGGNINEMIDAATGAGLTIDQFTGIVKSNAESLMFLGGTTSDGAKRLAEVGKAIRSTELSAELSRLGYSTVDINEGIAKFGGILARTGRGQNLNNIQLAAATGTYLKNLDAVSKLTGKTKDALEAEQAARMADAQYRMMLSKMSPEGALEFERLISSLPPGLQKAAKEIVSTGTATSEEGASLMALYPQFAQNLVNTNRTIRETGELQADAVSGMIDQVQAEAQVLSKSPLGDTLAQFGDTVQQEQMVAAYNLAQRKKNASDVDAQQKDELDNAKKNAKAAGTLDPARMMEFNQAIAIASNNAQKFLANSSALESMKNAFENLVPVLENVIMPVFELAAANIGVLIGTVLGLNVAMKALARTAATNAVTGGGKGGKGGKGGAAAGGKPSGGGVSAAGKGPGTLSKLGKGLKVATPTGLLAIGTGMASDAMGEDSEVGKGLGVASQALEYGTYGAMIGSIVPGFGTTLGGLAGGAVGLGMGIWDTYFAEKNEETIASLEKTIAAEQARIDKSNAGENEYWGDEESGRAESEAKIAEAKQKLAELRAKKEIDALAAGGKSSPIPGPEIQASPVNPTSSGTSASQQSLEQDATEKARKIKEEADKKAKEAAGEINGTVDGAMIQKDGKTDIAALNNNIEELVRLQRAQLATAQKQLSAQEGMSGDLFVNV